MALDGSVQEVVDKKLGGSERNEGVKSSGLDGLVRENGEGHSAWVKGGSENSVEVMEYRK